MLVTTDYFNKKALAAIAKHNASGAFDGPLSPTLLTVGLFKNNLVLTDKTVQADLTEADFTGYAPMASPTLLPVYQGPDGGYNLDSDVIQFLQTANTVTNTVFGYYVSTSADSGKLLFAELFDNSIDMNAADRAINMVFNVEIGPASMLGSAVVIGG